MLSHDPDAISLVISAGMVRAQNSMLRVEPQRGQVSENGSETSNSEHWGVLHVDVSGSYFANDASELRPESRLLSLDACTLAGCADVLTRESAANNVDCSSPRFPVKGGDVIPDGEGLEMAFALSGEEHVPAIGINFNSADGAPSKQLACQDAAACSCK
jgi:hypothetical protein